MPELNCPSCGAKLEFRSTISLIAVCPHCRSQVLRENLNLKDLGKVAELHQDGSVLQLASRGAYRGAPFTVIGRLQLRFPEGYWNEWFLWLTDGRQGWLGEAAGMYALTFPVPNPPDIPTFERLSLGQDVRIGDEAYEVTDIRHARYLSADGELPFKPPLGDEAPFVDLRGSGARVATLDYSEDQPLVFAGEYVPFAELKLDGLKAVDGW